MTTPPNHKKDTNIQDLVGEETLQIIANAQRFNRWMFERIAPFLNGNVLEIGSGIGNITRFALEHGLTVTASDYNKTYQELLKKKLAGYSNLAEVYSIDLQSQDLPAQLPELREKFDSIFLLNVIEHLEDEKVAIANCRYMLRPGGTLILLAPSYNALYCEFDKQLGHYRRYTKKTMAGIFPVQEFNVIHQEYFNLAGVAGWLIFGKLLKRRQIGSEMNLYEKLVPFFRLIDKISFRRIGLSTITVAEKLS